MLKISMLPVMARMVSKLDLKPATERLKDLDVFKAGQTKITAEQMGILAVEILESLLPQVEKVAVEIPEFVALYKGVSVAEANELDFAEIIAEIRSDEGITGFFGRALHKKAGQ